MAALPIIEEAIIFLFFLLFFSLFSFFFFFFFFFFFLFFTGVGYWTKILTIIFLIGKEK